MISTRLRHQARSFASCLRPDECLDLKGQLAGVTVGPAAAFRPCRGRGSCRESCGSTRTPCTARPSSPRRVTGHTPQALVHLVTLPPGHLRTPAMPKSVTDVSGTDAQGWFNHTGQTRCEARTQSLRSVEFRQIAGLPARPPKWHGVVFPEILLVPRLGAHGFAKSGCRSCFL